jgi:Bacterial Ig domain
VLHEDVGNRRRWLAPFVVVCAAGVLATACQPSSGSGAAAGPSGKPSPSTSPDQLSFTPASGTSGADPGKGITVTAAEGTIKSVTVTGSGLTGDRAVTGTFNSSHTVWHSNWTLPVAKTLTVTAVGVGPDGDQATQTSTFKTLDPPQTFSTHIFEGCRSC